MSGRDQINACQNVGGTRLSPEQPAPEFHLHDAGVSVDGGGGTTDDTLCISGADGNWKLIEKNLKVILLFIEVVSIHRSATKHRLTANREINFIRLNF